MRKLQHNNPQKKKKKAKMVNLFTALNPLLRALMKLYGMGAQAVEIQPGTVINFWAPIQTIKNYKNNKKSKKPTTTINDTEKPVVVLIHGFAGTAVLTWLFQVAALSGNYAVYVPDLLFFGGSITDSPHRSPEFQAECLARGLKLLGVERCTVVGCSYGGFVGSKMAESDPVLVESLVLSNSIVGFSELQSQEVLDRLGFESWTQFLMPNNVEGLKMLLGHIIYWRPWFPDWAYKHFLKVMFENREERAELMKAMIIKNDEYVIPNYSQVGHLSSFTPLTLMINYFSVVFLRTLFVINGEKASLHCIKKAGHLVHLERPFVYNRCLKKILASLRPDQDGAHRLQ
ncbi:hypothetical protein FEM48_Zijuj09G0103600 [Ziziphus jujuba var. spinosa]|uniref:AB hydrolase-1 domain-containing protein n=1 Tax=Ziziphus jujuba var. spinosa TaxID=714518 RepID=A0A978USF9_ZIZJJ|nr:hypothetical protein FEM48_Zijuj09G0103600 [Ziziphus jujuba var. spinosa]